MCARSASTTSTWIIGGQHALAYSLLAFVSIWLSRRILWFGSGLQSLHVALILAMAQSVALLVRLAAGDPFPGWSIYVGIGAAVAVALIIGAFNGVMVAYFNFPSFVVTLGMLSIARSLAMVASNNTVVFQFGPDHDKLFHVEVRVDGELLGEAEGRTKKDAEQEAARRALLRLTNVER